MTEYQVFQRIQKSNIRREARVRPIFALFFLSFLVGCSLPRFKGANFEEAEKPFINQEKATVYVYRVGQGKPNESSSVMLFVDDKKVFHVRDKGFTWFYLEPGLHRFTAEWPWEDYPLFEEGHFSEKFLTVTVEAGKTYYINYQIVTDLRQDTFMETRGLLWKALSKSHIISVGLVQENEKTALFNLEGCGYQSNNFR